MRKINQLLHHNSATQDTTTTTGTTSTQHKSHNPLSNLLHRGSHNTATTSSGLPATGTGFGSNLGETTTFSSTTVESTGVMMDTAAPMSSVNVLPAQVEIREKAPVVQEVIKPGVREEIQPVIHREREQMEIREEIQPIYERQVQPTVLEHRELAAELRPEVRMGAMPIIAEGPRSSVFVEAEQREAVVHAPIVEEVVHKKIIEEVQPVIQREVIAPKVIHEVKPIYEKIIEAPTVSYTTLPPQFNATPMSTGFSDVVTTTTTTVESEILPLKTNAAQVPGASVNPLNRI